VNLTQLLGCLISEKLQLVSIENGLAIIGIEVIIEGEPDMRFENFGADKDRDDLIILNDLIDHGSAISDHTVRAIGPIPDVTIPAFKQRLAMDVGCRRHGGTAIETGWRAFLFSVSKILISDIE
jgi:hypothetical protein